MSLVCLEGPDRCGKSTLFNQLREHVDAVFVPRMCADALLHVVQHVEVWQEQLWRALYDPRKLYVLDRSFTVTPEVYSKLYDRELLFDPTPWRAEQLVLYVDTNVDELQRRHAATGDPFDATRYGEVLALYSEVLAAYNHRRVTTLEDCLAELQDAAA